MKTYEKKEEKKLQIFEKNYKKNPNIQNFFKKNIQP
jgi:hypothetical protein